MTLWNAPMMAGRRSSAALRTCVFALAAVMAFCLNAAAEVWTLAWAPVTTYADGTPLPESRSVRYNIYWSRDSSLGTGTLSPLVSATSALSAEFDPQAEGMAKNEWVYFAATATLDTGAESSLSEVLRWRVSNTGPGTPTKGRIVKKK